MTAPFDRLFLMASEERSDVCVDPISPDQVARRMRFSLRFERLDFLSWYERFRFAFPDRPCALVDEAPEREALLLQAMLAGKPAHIVRHPYPVELDRLYEAMAPYC